MNGETSLGSLNDVTNQFEQQLAASGSQARDIAENLFDVTKILGDNSRLARAITDPSRDGQAKQTLARTIFEHRVQPVTLQILEALAQEHWSKPKDVVDATEMLAMQAIGAYMDSEDCIARVSIELSQLRSALLPHPIVRQRFSDEYATAEERVRFLHSILRNQALHPITMLLAEYAARNLRRRYLSTLLWMIEVITKHRGKTIITVTTAVELRDEQIHKIKHSYSQRLGRAVFVNAVVDPAVLGGIRIQYGSTVLDQTVLAQLEQLQRAVQSA